MPHPALECSIRKHVFKMWRMTIGEIGRPTRKRTAAGTSPHRRGRSARELRLIKTSKPGWKRRLHRFPPLLVARGPAYQARVTAHSGEPW